MGANLSNPCLFSRSSFKPECKRSHLQSQTPQSKLPNHLDTVPPEVLHYVLRNLSATPRSQNWQAAVPLDDAATLLSATRSERQQRMRNVFRRTPTEQQQQQQQQQQRHTVLHHAAVEAFQGLAMQRVRAPFEFEPDSISFNHLHTTSNHDLEAGTLVVSHSNYRTRRSERRARNLLANSVPFAQNIHVAVHYRPRAWARALEKQAPVIRSLTINRVESLFPLHRVLKASTQLQKLDITAMYLTPAQANSIGEYCRNLRSLTLDCDAYWNDCEPLWRGVGDSLESLTLSTQYSSYDGGDLCEWRTAFGHIEEHCPNITSLAFESFPPDTHTSILSLCTRYGKQLQNLRLVASFMTPRLYTQLISACLNVEINVQVLAEALIPSMAALGEHLSALHVTGDELAVFLGDEKQLKAACDICTQLRVLTVHPHDMATSQLAPMVMQLVSSTKQMPFLHTVEIYERYSELYAELAAGMNATMFASMVNRLGHGTRALKHLHLSCTRETPIVAAAQLNQLALANPGLETVAIRIAPYLSGEDAADGEDDYLHSNEPNKHPVDRALANVVTAFGKCPKLRSIVVDEQLEALPRERYKAIDDACAPLRHRRVTVRILDEVYLA